MKQKKKYYFIGTIAFLGIIVGYHFYAAYEAERQIDTAIQEQTAKTNNISVEYSSIDITPFSGKVSISDLTIILGNNIERALQLQLDVSYLDFVNIYLGGTRYGLENLHKASITLIRPSYVNQSGLEEIKADTLHISYRGNALKGLLSAINGIPFGAPQHVEAQSSGLIVRLPESTLHKLVARRFSYSGDIAEGSQDFWINGRHQFGINSITWTPSDSFQNTYSFFIKGFGYPTDAIPFESAHLDFEPASQPKSILIESTVKSELALFSSSGIVNVQTPLGSSNLQNFEISITEFSDKFSQVLNNIEKLLYIALPREQDGIRLKLAGTLANPKLSK
ncbi:MAG: hypothetical protein PVI44_00330 [Balneolaceae bacterium]|jgi:hypothetical protein